MGALDERDAELPAETGFGDGPDDYLDIAAEAREAIEHAAFGDAAKLSFEDRGESRLSEPEQRCGFGLAEAARFYDFCDFGNQLGFDQHGVAVGIAEIGVDVAAALLN